MSFTQDDDDQDVGEKCDEENAWHDEAIDGDGEGWGTIPCRAIDVVAVTFVPTVTKGVNLIEKESFSLLYLCTLKIHTLALYLTYNTLR